MTPTLSGRWQTRLLLLATIGVLVTLFFGWLYGNYRSTFAILGYVLLFGFFWDALWQFLESFRWDHDWPPIFQLGAGIVEGLFVWILLVATGLPGVAGGITFGQFVAHYATVWLATFLASQSLLRIIFPRWRYHGGQWM
ncbi:MAG TPA: hypothetical protein VER55_13455 [Ardenticatenaceae bacterium]|nr:hypothetical protein [Ardenticatenaceae bacterium]